MDDLIRKLINYDIKENDHNKNVKNENNIEDRIHKLEELMNLQLLFNTYTCKQLDRLTCYMLANH